MTDIKSEQVKVNPSRKKVIIAAATVLVLCVAGFVAFWLTNGDAIIEARIMEIFRVDGPNVSLTRGMEATLTASAGARLHDGYGVFTGEDSICHIRLDTDSLVRMDSRSRIYVNRVTATTLSILVEDGQVLIDVQNQYPGHEVEIVVGNFAIGVRGTLFIAGQGGAADETQILMLEGSVYVDDDVPLSAGYVMFLQDDEPFEVSRLTVEDLDMFAMLAVLDYRERVLEAGALTEEELAWIERMMNVPDYIWIQGVQISTGLTELHIISDTNRNFPRWRYSENLIEMNLTNVDIEQLIYMVNLTTLTLDHQQISDLSPLTELVNLKDLWLESNQISNISSLAGLTALTVLNLNFNLIYDISPLAGLMDLTSLELQGNQISDIAPIAGLMDLTALHMSENNVSDFSPLAELMNLTHLSATLNPINDITPLAGLTNLTHLGLSNNQINDISPLVELTNLTWFMFSVSPIYDITPLAGFPNLTSLILANNQISDVAPLSELTNLTNLRLDGNQIIDITPLVDLSKLTVLWLQGNPITDWSPVAHVETVHGRP